MLHTVILVAVLLITVEFWLSFFMGAGTIAFWTVASVLMAGFIAALYQNQFLIFIPFLFAISVYAYAIICYHLIDRPRMARARRQHTAL